MKRRMSAKQKKYFGKRISRSTGVKRMAGKRYGRVRHAVSKGRSFGGSFGGIIPPIVGGVADAYFPKIMGVNGLGSTLVGWFMKDQTTRNIGLYQIGQSIPAVIGGLTGSGGATKAGWL